MTAPAPSLQHTLLAEAAELFQPLELLESAGAIVELLEELGWDFPAPQFPATFPSIVGEVEDVVEALQELVEAADESGQRQAAAQLVTKVSALAVSVGTLVSQFETALTQLAAFRDNSDLEDDLVRRLLDYLVVAQLAAAHPVVFRVFELLGLAGWVETQAEPTRFRLATRIARVEWERIPLLFSDPAALAAEAYDWGGDFDADLFLARLTALLAATGLPGHPLAQDPRLRSALGRTGTDDNSWRFVLLREMGSAGVAEAGLQASGIPATSTKAKGLAVFPYLAGTATLSAQAGPMTLEMGGSLSLDTGLAAILRPPADLVIQANMLTSPAPPTQAAFFARARLGAPGTKTILAGEAGKTRVAMESFALGFKGEKDPSREDFAVELDAKGLELAVVPGDGDGFLQKVLPPEGIRSEFDVLMGVSTIRGLYFEGSAALEVTIPLHVSIGGVINLDSIWLRVGAADRELEIVAAVTGGLKLGPIAASVERIGLKTLLDFPEDQDGNFGAVDAQLGFKPPDGMGLKVGAGPVGGGGYLFFDPKNEQYAGVLQLDFKAISLKAIGLLTTRMPDGSKGFSLLIIITAEFPPIQLGFGFTLNGVGGLVGINRTLVVDVLRAGIKTGAVGSILFPKDPVANAPQLLSDLRAIFPPAPDRVVFGPMAKLGWGSPTLISLELGIIIELPSPVVLVILGRLSMVLPDKEAPVLSLNMDVLGIVEFEKGEASLDATLFDSRLVAFTLTGDMALRAGWGAQPHFELSVGGFHPRFEPPPRFPALDRLALTLADSDNPRLRLECYFALTSNSLQMGARLDFHVHVDIALVGNLSVDAYLGFDVLLRFTPFSLEADMGASVSLKRNGSPLLAIELDLHLTGPGPWHAWGKALFDFLGKREIPVDVTFGDQAPPAPLPESRPQEELESALTDPGNWSAQLPQSGGMLVTLRELKPAQGELLTHPFGEIAVRQRVVPLGVTIQKYGASVPVGPRRFDITAVSVGGSDVTDSSEATREHFAPGQFFELSDAEKLSRPGFEAMGAGTRFGAAGLSAPAGIETNFGYEDIVVDVEPNTGFKQRRPGAPRTYKPRAAVVAALAQAETVPPDQELEIALAEPVYAVASTGDLTEQAAVGATLADELTYTEATEVLRGHVVQKPGERHEVQVVASHEVVPA